MRVFSEFYRSIDRVASSYWAFYLICFFTLGLVFNSSDSVQSHFDFYHRNATAETSFSEPPRLEPYYAEDDSVAREMYEKHRVLCWVMTGPANHQIKAKYVKQTWGKRCNILLFMSTENDDSLPTVKLPLVEGRRTLWGKTREAFRYVWKNYKDQADWFVKADDDTFLIVENLRYVLSSYNTSEPLYFGHKYKALVKKGYMAGGSGYTLSKEALRRFAEIGVKNSTICRSDVTGAEDVEMGKCMENLDVKAVDTRDSYGRQRYLPLNLKEHVSTKYMNKNDWLWKYTYYPIKMGTECCSDTIIAFHYVTPKEMLTYDFLIYHVQPFGVVKYRSFVQKQPIPSPDANLTETPFPGVSEEDEKAAEKYEKEKEDLRKRAEEIKKKAKLMDQNETLRNAEIEKLMKNWDV